MRHREGGQATVEWTALVLAIAVMFGALGYAVARAAPWRLGGEIIDAIACAVGDGCPGALEDAYGARVAADLRRYAPNIAYERRSAQLPIDFRRCREPTCSNGSDRPAPIDESASGLPVTAFTRVVDRRGEGGSLYLQYWLYFPESFSGEIGRLVGHRWPGYHRDDWEGVQIRVRPGGEATARATSHGGYSSALAGGWGRWKGWYRVSGGSHAGQLVSSSSGERTTAAGRLRLVPLETLRATDLYRFDVAPPWQKAVYRDPEAVSS